jgi:hypothetical protein
MKRGDFFACIPKMYCYQTKAPFTEIVEELHNVSGIFIKSTYLGKCSQTGDSLFKDIFRNKTGKLFHMYRKEALLNSDFGLYRVHYSLEPFQVHETATT